MGSITDACQQPRRGDRARMQASRHLPSLCVMIMTWTCAGGAVAGPADTRPATRPALAGPTTRVSPPSHDLRMDFVEGGNEDGEKPSVLVARPIRVLKRPRIYPYTLEGTST